MMKTIVVAALFVFAGQFLTVERAQAQTKRNNACFTCESLCRACEKAGLQKANGTCAAGCRNWASNARVTQILVRNDLSVCGTAANSYSSARCF